ncbi:MAG: serine/threonine-protein kinase [Minicystis sp.]
MILPGTSTTLGDTCPVSMEAPFATTTESVDSFLAEVAKVSVTPGPASIPRFAAGAVIADRYRLTRPLGRGGHGAVWEAHDRLAREDVAVKLLAAGAAAHAARVRREIASLRRLRLPGVVRLLDEGLDGEHVFLVMPIVRGLPFPGAVGARWEEIALPTELLLATLAEVHATGVVHRDLKPANVLVVAHGRPVVLDFGLSQAPAFEAYDEAGQIVGTPLYLAPEQIRGAPVDARTDLYAVGVMLYHALSGRAPHDGADLRALLLAKLDAAPAPLAKAAPHVPAPVARAVDALLATSPDDRPASAREARSLLWGEITPAALPSGARRVAVPPGAPLGEDRLRALFAASARLSWVGDDAARLLHERTGGDPARVDAEIDAWVRAGFCRWDDAGRGRLLIDRDAVDRLEANLWVRASPDDAAAFAEEAITLARRLAEGGRLGNAVAALHEGISALRREAAAPAGLVERVLSLWVEVALADRTPLALDRVLHEICRTGAISPRVEQLEGLVRAALAVGAWTPRALDLASAVPPFADPALEILRCSIRVAAARRTSMEREEAVIAELSSWAAASPDPEVRTAFAGWLGRLRYRQGRYDEAAALHAQAASEARWVTTRATALVSTASALMEAYRLDEAAATAARAVAMSRASRHVYGCAQAEWTARTIAHRRAEILAPDPAWIDAVAALSIPELEALVCMTEAAIAWRAGDLAAALAIARRAERAWSSVGEGGGGLLLVSALAVVCGGAPGAAAAIAREAIACPTLTIGIQVLGLLAPWLDPDLLAPARVRPLAAHVAEPHWPERLDVLSVREALDRIAARLRVS